MIALLDPYQFVRLLTFLLALVWTVRGAVRAWGSLRHWERRLNHLGMNSSWLRRCVALSILRATVLDPVNLALMLTLAGVWVMRPSLWFS